VGAYHRTGALMVILPFEPSIPNYRFGTTIDSTPYILDVRWNARSNAWFLDVFEVDEVPIFRGAKIVLGTYLGRRANHPLVRRGVLLAVDTSGAGLDAGLDDLGTRVQVRWYPQSEIAGGARALGVDLHPL
jgi:hypothetical protein